LVFYDVKHKCSPFSFCRPRQKEYRKKRFMGTPAQNSLRLEQLRGGWDEGTERRGDEGTVRAAFLERIQTRGLQYFARFNLTKHL
jgi:hypothetical protein